jgi:hydrogenase/urease accessory protein HupE
MTMRVAILLALARVASAHGFDPAVWALDETAPGRFATRWTPSAREPGAAQPAAPSGCALEGATLLCPHGLAGASFAAAGDVVLRIQFLDGNQLTTVLSAAWQVPAEPAGNIPWRYTRLGVFHILTGVDHLLFVLGLFLLVGRRWRLLGVLTAFTVGHSVTLAAATLGWVAVPQQPVEAMIALSLVLVAYEIAHGRSLARPHFLALGFGLLHGLGFAGALAETGLPRHSLALALGAFNIGVELGQIFFVAVLALVLRKPWRAPAYAIGAVGVALIIDRVLGFAR